MAIVEELIAVLGYEVRGKDNLQSFKGGIDDAEKSLKGAGTAGVVAGAAIGGAITAGAAAVWKATKNYAGFERHMVRIGNTAGASAEEVAKAGAVVQELASQFALPIDEAVGGLDTLVASGKSLDEALAFLPSVLATAQASGAAVDDIANTALKATGALGIATEKLQNMFDLLTAGGNAGQFELKDMSRFIPELANSFANLGYKGMPGLTKLVALLQTLREDAGTAGQARTWAQNIFGKMRAPQTEKAFENYGKIENLGDKLDEAQKKGEDIISAFVRLTKQAQANGAKLEQLFTDTEFRLGMTSLLSSMDRFQFFQDSFTPDKIDGAVFKQLASVLDDTQASIDRATISMDRFWKTVGAGAAPAISGVLDTLTKGQDYVNAVAKGQEKAGMTSWWEREWWNFINGGDKAKLDEFAKAGGYIWPKGQEPAKPPAPPPQSGTTMPAGGWLNTLGGGHGSLDNAAAAISQDNSTTNNTQNITVSAPVTVNVQQATEAPGAVGNAVSGAINGAAQNAPQPGRMQPGPVSP